MSNNNGTVGMMLGIMVGAAVGAILGLLMAPASGEETRRKIGETAGRLREEGLKHVDNLRGIATERAEDVREAVKAGKDAYREARSARETSREPSMGS
jgi:gas vesicle protein